MLVKTLILLLLAAWILRRALSGRQGLRWRGKVFLSLCALVAVGNFFLAHVVAHEGMYLHKWDTFHSYMGSKYFDELGHFELYNATAVADHVGQRWLDNDTRVRDLRTYEVLTRPQVLRDRHRTRALFSDERWEAFKADVETFQTEIFQRPGRFRKMFQDHGYNGTPVFTGLLHLVTNTVPVTYLPYLLLPDLALLVLMFAVVAGTWGLEVCLLALLFFCSNFLNDLRFVGGSLLRFDWLVASVIGLCLLEKRRSILSGACFAYAVVIRIFPLLFLAGLAARLASRLFRPGPERRELLRFAGAFAVSAVLLCGFTLSLDAPAAALGEFRENLQLHGGSVSWNHIGAKQVLLWDESYLSQGSYFEAYPTNESWHEAKRELFQSRRGTFYGVLLLTGLAFLAAFRKKDHVALCAWSVLLVFPLLSASHYYYAFLILPFLGFLRPTSATRTQVYLVALLLLQAAWHVVGAQTPFYLTTCTYVSISFAAWLAIVLACEAWTTLRRGSGPRPETLPEVAPSP